jgi:SAM-dependent methyltransferase
MHENSRRLFETHVLPFVAPGAHVLELAPDGTPSTLRRCAHAIESLTWETAELAPTLVEGVSVHTGVRTFDYSMATPYEIPVEPGRYDLVLAANVLEHVPAPWRWIRELARVCRPGGRVALVTPISWGYHPAPLDCWRAYPDGLRALAEEGGLVAEIALFGSTDRRPRHSYPGEFGNWRRYVPQRMAVRRLLGAVGWPLPVAVDSVLVAVKPGP